MAECDCYGRPCVLDEFRRLKEFGPAVALAEYHAESRRRIEQAGGESKRAADAIDRCMKLGVPAVTLNALQKTLNETPAMAAARQFLRRDKKLVSTLLMLGPTGCGKTLSAGYVFRDRVKSFDWNGQPTKSILSPFVWVQASALTGVSHFGEEHVGWRRSMQEAWLLVLDDIGDEGTQAGITSLTNIVLGRMNGAKATVLTGNISGEAFGKRYGKALVDRLKEQAIKPNLFGQSSLRRKDFP